MDTGRPQYVEIIEKPELPAFTPQPAEPAAAPEPAPVVTPDPQRERELTPA